MNLLILLSLLALSSPATAAEEGFRAAIAAAKGRDLPKARSLFESLLKESPGNALYQFNYANILYLDGDYAGAAALYSKVSASGSNLAKPAAVYLGRCLDKLGEAGLAAYKAGNFEEAGRAWKLRAALSPAPDAQLAVAMAAIKAGKPREAEAALQLALDREVEGDLATQALALLSQLRAGAFESARVFFPELRLGLGFDSNFYGDADNANESPEGKAVFQAGARARHVLLQGERFFWLNLYNIGTEGPFSPAADRTLGYGIETQAIFARDKLLVAPFLRFDHFFIDGTSPYFVQPSAGLKARRRMEAWELGADYSFSRPSVTANSTYAFLAGNIHEGSLSASRDGPVSWGLSVRYLYSGTGDLASGTQLVPLRNAALGPSVFALTRFGANWELYGRLSYLARTYSTLAQPGAIRRKDDLLNAAAQVTRELGSGLRAFLSASLTRNRSTLGPSAPDDKNYDQLLLQSGVSWSLE